ncbi:MAG TPA: hypothetical protein VF749_15010 [Candidatus Acidoferrum sp.]
MNAPPLSVPDARQQAWQYWFEDGLTHLLLGIAILSISICTLYPPRPRAFWQLAIWAAMLTLYTALMLRQRQILEWLKTKITYPRTGYVQSPFDVTDLAASPNMIELGLTAADERRAEARRLLVAQRRQVSLAAALAVAGSLALLLIESRWAYTVIGVLFALALWALRRNEKVSWIAIVGLPILGTCMTVFSVPGSYPPNRVAWFMAGWGGLFVLDGTIALTRYLLRNPMSKVAEP